MMIWEGDGAVEFWFSMVSVFFVGEGVSVFFLL